MKNIFTLFICAFFLIGLEAEEEKTFGKGLPRDSSNLIPLESEYPEWVTPEFSSVDPRRMKQVVKDISNIALESKERTPYWGRLPGTPEDKKTMDYIAKKLSSLGFTLEKRDIVIPTEWRPSKWNASYSINGKSFNLKSSFPSGESIRLPKNKIKAEAIWVGLGAEADFIGRDVKGKAVVIYSMFVPGGRSHSASSRSKLFNANNRAAAKGAALIINIMGVPGNAQYNPSPYYYTNGTVIPSFDMPIITINQDEGFQLRDRMATEKVIIDFDLEIDILKNVKTSYLIARLEGASDEEIFLAGHTDGYFQGSMDNASGIAVGLEIAEYFSLKDKAGRPRSLTMFFLPDHHHGEFSRLEFDKTYNWENVAMVLTLEHTSQTQLHWYNNNLMTSNAVGSFRWHFNGSDEFKKIFKKRLKENGVSTYTHMDNKPKFTRNAPGFHIIDHVIYHTTLDTPELVPAEGLKRSTKAFLGIIEDVNKMNLEELR
jgi:hypothetical protein